MTRGRLFLLLIVFFTGCVRPASLVDRSLDGYRALSGDELARFQRVLASSAEEIESGRVELVSTVQQGIHQDEVRQIIVFKQPHSLRVETFATAANQLLSIVTAREGEFRAFDGKERRYLRGTANAENALKILSLPFAPEEIMVWICGRMPYPSTQEASFRALAYSAKRAFAVETTLRDGRRLFARLKLHHPSGGTPRLLLEGLEVSDSHGGLLFSSQFTSDASGAHVPFPSEISLSLPARKVTATVALRPQSVNSVADNPRLFEVSIPETAEVVSIDRVEQEQ